MKIHTNKLGHISKMAAMPIYDQIFKNLLFRKHWTDDLGTWHIATIEIVQMMTLSWP